MFPVLDATGEPISIQNAIRGVTYQCPECKKKLMVRDGQRRRKHFAHHKKSQCAYNSGGGESSTHLAAKLSLVEYLAQGNELNFIRQCGKCKENKQHQIKTKDDETVKAEHRLVYEGKTIIPDVAIIRPTKKVGLIVEIRHTHTQENRPEPWYEFDASAVISTLGKEQKTLYDLRCVPCVVCQPPSDVAISCTACRSPTAPTLLNSVNVCLRCRIKANRRTPYTRVKH